MSSEKYTREQLCATCSLICSKRRQNTAGNCSRYQANEAVLIAHITHNRLGPIFDEHWHEQFQLLYFRKGSISIHCNGVAYDLNQGNIFVINSNELHYGSSNALPTQYSILKIDFKVLFRNLFLQEQLCYIERLLKNQILFTHKIKQDSRLSQLIEQLIQESEEQKSGYELAVSALANTIIVHLLRYYQQPLISPARMTNSSYSFDQLRPALLHLEQNFCENIQLKELAGLANMSSQHFCRLFKSLTGKRPMDYINFLRINKAVSLLSENHFNISEVALAVGFNDTNYFSRVFKKYKQVSPSMLRRLQINTGKTSLNHEID